MLLLSFYDAGSEIYQKGLGLKITNYGKNGILCQHRIYGLFSSSPLWYSKTDMLLRIIVENVCLIFSMENGDGGLILERSERRSKTSH
jgi:hypothetical protein